MPLLKNVAGQKIAVFAYDVAAGVGKTGDQANITARISKDFEAGAPVIDTNPVQLDATNHPGWYIFDLAQAESNADCIIFTPSSTTAGIRFAPLVIYPTVYDATKAGYIDASILARPTNPLLTNDARLNNLDAAISTRAATGADADTLKTLSDQLDVVQTDLDNPAQYKATGFATPTNVSDTQTAITNAIAALNNISVANILAGVVNDAQVFASGTLGDLLRKVLWMIANKLVVVDVNGNYTLYKNDGITVAATGNIADDLTNTTRSVPAWS